MCAACVPPFMQVEAGTLVSTRIAGLSSVRLAQCSQLDTNSSKNTGVKYNLHSKTVVLKPFHVRDPQIDTYQPTDPHLERHAR